MKTNDLKNGAYVRLRCGWLATIKDSRKGNIRLAEVYGDFTEIGSVYAHDIEAVLIDNRWVKIEHTPKQINSKRMNDLLW